MDKKQLQILKDECKNLKLLYVEDNKSVRDSTVPIFQKFFKNVAVAVDGVDGFDKFSQNEFDLVITDINMPKMNGIEMIEKIRSLNKDVFILVISAHSESGYFLETIKLNIDGYLLKPLHLEQFMNQLMKTVEKITLIKESERYKKGLEITVDERTKALEFQYYHDVLTGFKNNNTLLEEIENEYYSAVLVLEIDDFQDYIDLYGLKCRDEIIKSFAKLLEDNLDESFYDIYHLLDDKFALRIKEGNYDIQNFESDIKVLFKKISASKVYFNDYCESMYVDVTIGACFKQEYVFEKALKALRYAKKLKKPYIAYTNRVNGSEKSKETLFWKNEIRDALNGDKFIPVFQPIVDREQNIVKYEALIRLAREKDGSVELVSPFFFLETAIKTKQYGKLTEVMVKKSFSIMQKQQNDFSLNLSFEDIINASTMKMLKKQIDEYQIGSQLIIEIVESENVEDYTIVKNFIKDFRTLGVKIAIDDFGAGFSNYKHILEIEPDFLKLDGSIIKDIDKSKKSYEFVKSIVQLAKALNIITIAEFVHSKEVFDICYKLEIDEFQGYYFCEPKKFNELTPVVSIVEN